MVRIAPINMYFNPKTLWFDAGDFNMRAGDGVIVTTARGVEFGRASGPVFEADAAQVKKLKTPLKPVTRMAEPEDEAQAAEMERLSADALPIFKEMAADAGGDMHPVSVEYLFDGDKAIFYFEAEERVDFRDLVRKLAARFHIRVDMRQIGVRDEARMVGGLGHCGQELCCKRLGGEFCPVSIRMAKEQDLSLNPQKISGVCGRLMCCLRYEFDAYKDFKSRAPKYNAQVETPVGKAKVIDLDVPREVITLKVDGEKPVKVPLADFEPPDEGVNRPNRVGEEAWEDATTQVPLGVAGESSIFATTQLTGQDKLADPAAVRRTGKGSQKASRMSGSGSTQGAKGSARSDSKQAETPTTASRKPRRRRSTKVGGEEGRATSDDAQQRHQKPQGQGAQKQQGGQPGQQKKRSGQNGGKKQQSSRSASDAPKKQNDSQGTRQGGPRPGQKSSGLRQQKQQGSDNTPRRERPATNGGEGQQTGDGGHRRARRRSHKAGGAGEQGGTSATTGGNE